MAKIDNQTELPHAQTKSIVRWVLRELGVDDPTLMVRIVRMKERDRTYGRFYPDARVDWPNVWKQRSINFAIPEEAQHLIVIRLPREPHRPAETKKYKGGPPEYEVTDWRESLLCLAAHEAMHVRHHLYPKPGHPRWSEVEAEWAEYRLLKRWRSNGK